MTMPLRSARFSSMKRMSGSTRSTPGSSGVGKGDAAIDDDPLAARRPGRSRRARSSCRSRRRRPAERRPVRALAIGHQNNLSGAHAAPAEATAPKCTSPAAILTIFAAARADHEAAVVVDRLEHAAHDIAVDADRDVGAQAGGARQPVVADARQPAALVPVARIRPSRRRTAPGTSVSGVGIGAERGERGCRIGQAFADARRR